MYMFSRAVLIHLMRLTYELLVIITPGRCMIYRGKVDCGAVVFVSLMIYRDEYSVFLKIYLFIYLFLNILRGSLVFPLVDGSQLKTSFLAKLRSSFSPVHVSLPTHQSLAYHMDSSNR